MGAWKGGRSQWRNRLPHQEERWAGFAFALGKGEVDEEAKSKAGRTSTSLRCAGGVRAGGDGASMDCPRGASGGRDRGGRFSDRGSGDPGARCKAREDRAP